MVFYLEKGLCEIVSIWRWHDLEILKTLPKSNGMGTEEWTPVKLQDTKFNI